MKRKKQKACLLLFCLLTFILFLAPGSSAHVLIKEDIEKSLIIVGGDYSYPPFEFLDKNGNPTGFNTELTKAIAGVAGLNIAIILGPWSEIRDALETEKIDVIQGMFYSRERDRTFDFTTPQSILSHTIFTRTDTPRIASVEELRNKEIIVMRGGIMHDYVLKNKLTNKITAVDTEAEALKLLASGKHDTVLGARLTGLYWIKELNLSNIRASDINVSEDKYCFAVKEGNLQLLSRLNEGLMILKTSGEYQKIYNKWFSVHEKRSLAREIILNFTLYILLPVLVLLGGVLFWTWFLRKQVSLRTRELEREITERKRAEQQLQESEKKFRSISSSALDGIAMIDSDGNISFWNQAAEGMFGYSSEELLGKNLHLTLIPRRYHDDYRKAFSAFQKSGTGDAVGKTLEFAALRKDGSEFPVELSVSALRLQDQWHAVGIIRDITERKQAEQQLNSLYELGKKIVSIISKEELLPWIAEKAAGLLNSEGCTFRIRKGDYLVRAGGFGESVKLMKKEKLRIGESLSGWVAKEKKPVIVEDIKEDSRYIKKHQEIARKHSFVSYLGIPMMIGGEVVGVINIHTKEKRGFTRTEIALLSSFADVAAIALENSRLFENLEKEVSERKQAEEKIKTSLKEKELLLKEIHHRVKNNMQVISSILSLQSSSLKDEEAVSVFMQCQDRIKSMAIVHEKLYQSTDLSRISFKGYTETLVETIFRSYSKEGEKISLKLDVEDILLDVDTVIPIGLILNELITNSLKYAFEGREKGEIKIAFQEIDKDKLKLEVRDNGTGIPEGFDVRNTDSLGLKLVFLLAEEQLMGRVDVNRNGGTEFQITFQKAKRKGS